MKIFLSHINEEAQIAQTLKEWIESTFPGSVEVFVSSDKGSLPPGKKWLDVISENLAGADLLLVLCSAESIIRPWVNFETGAGWVKEIETIPICHSGLTMADLPRPLNDFQGLVIEDDSFTEDLINEIGKKIGIKTAPRLHYNEFSNDLLKAMKSVSKKEIQTESNDINSDSKTDLDENAIKILTILAQNPSSRGISIENLSANIGISQPVTKYTLNELNKLDFISYSYWTNRPATSHISNKGLEYAVKNKLVT